MTPAEFTTRIEQFTAAAAARTAGGLTVEEIGQILTDLVHLAIDAARELELPGQDKKQWVLQALAFGFEQLAGRLVLPWYLAPLRPVLTAAARRLLVSFWSGGIESILVTSARRKTPKR